MIVTEIRVKLSEGAENERLLAYCSITLDNDFVVRDLKVIEGSRGPFVAMPSRKLTDRCPECGSKNHLRAKFCNWCGKQLGEDPLQREGEGRIKLHVDIAHPINTACRDMLQRVILEAISTERERARAPGYVCTYDTY